MGILVVALTVALNIGWIVISWREGLLLALGVIVSLLVIAGVVLNTIFLVREIRRNEQQDGFLNAVTHELKTPIASIRLYLETLQSREVDPQRGKSSTKRCCGTRSACRAPLKWCFAPER